MKRWWFPALLSVMVLAVSAVSGDTVFNLLILYAASFLIAAFAAFRVCCIKLGRSKLLLAYSLNIAILIWAAHTDLPFRIAFHLSESALQDVASRIKVREPLTLPFRAGLFTILEAGQRADGSIYLWTDPNPGGSDGFVLDPDQNGRGYNIWTKLDLGKGWYFICED